VVQRVPVTVLRALACDALANPPIIAIKFYNGLILVAFSIAMKWQPLEGVYAVFRLEGIVEGFVMSSWMYAVVTSFIALGLLFTRPTSSLSRHALLGASLLYLCLAVAFGLAKGFTGTATYGVLSLLSMTASVHTPSGKYGH